MKASEPQGHLLKDCKRNGLGIGHQRRESMTENRVWATIAVEMFFGGDPRRSRIKQPSSSLIVSFCQVAWAQHPGAPIN